MADQVNVKIVLENGDQKEIRKLMLSNSVLPYNSFVNKVQSVFPTLQGRNLTIHYHDVVGDLVHISSDDELILALKEMKDMCLYKFIVKLVEDEKQPSAEATCSPLISVEIDLPIYRCVCNHCDVEINEFRYKCLECDDYDLCAKCEAQGIHPTHFMLRIPDINNWRDKISSVMLKFLENTAYISAAQKHVNKHGHKCGHNRRACRRIAKAESAMKYFGFNLKGLQSDAEKKENFDFTKLFGNVRGFADCIAEFKTGLEPKEPPKDDKKSATENNKEECTGCEKDESKSNDAESEKAESEEAESEEAESEEAESEKAESEKAETVDEWMIIGDSETAGTDDKSKSKTAEEVQSETNKNESTNMTNLESPVVPEAVSQKDTQQQSEASPPSETTTPGDKKIYPDLNDTGRVFHQNPKIQAAVQSIMDMGFANQGGLITYLAVAEDGNIDKVLDILLH